MSETFTSIFGDRIAFLRSGIEHHLTHPFESQCHQHSCCEELESLHSSQSPNPPSLERPIHFLSSDCHAQGSLAAPRLSYSCLSDQLWLSQFLVQTHSDCWLCPFWWSVDFSTATYSGSNRIFDSQTASLKFDLQSDLEWSLSLHLSWAKIEAFASSFTLAEQP